MSLYQPGHFRPSVVETARANQLMVEFPFATVISWDSAVQASEDIEEPIVSHLPILTSFDSKQDGCEEFTLEGHMAKANPQSRLVLKRCPVLVVFNGPHGYITPQWYQSTREVPTWNYGVVHVRGAFEPIEHVTQLKGLLTRQSQQFERDRPNPWEFSLPADLEGPGVLEKAIVGFRIRIDRIDAKFKMSQNRGLQDLLGVLNGLESSQHAGDRELAKWMREGLEKKNG